nr:MAG TPA: hypothetical protein [Caudoviricetes sp.]
MPIVRNQVRTVLLVSIPLTERTRPFYYVSRIQRRINCQFYKRIFNNLY